MIKDEYNIDDVITELDNYISEAGCPACVKKDKQILKWLKELRDTRAEIKKNCGACAQ